MRGGSGRSPEPPLLHLLEVGSSTRQGADRGRVNSQPIGSVCAHDGVVEEHEGRVAPAVLALPIALPCAPRHVLRWQTCHMLDGRDVHIGDRHHRISDVEHVPGTVVAIPVPAHPSAGACRNCRRAKKRRKLHRLLDSGGL